MLDFTSDERDSLRKKMHEKMRRSVEFSKGQSWDTMFLSLSEIICDIFQNQEMLLQELLRESKKHTMILEEIKNIMNGRTSSKAE